MLFLDSVITRGSARTLKTGFVLFMGVKEENVPFLIHEHFTYLQNLHGWHYDTLKQDLAQLIASNFRKVWSVAGKKIILHIRLTIRTKTPNIGSYATLEDYSPAVWFALKGK